MQKHNRIATPFISVLIFIIAMWQFLPTIDEREFHRDEARWIHRAVYVRELANPFSDYWDESTWQDGASLDHRNRLRAQPPVGSYVMGVGFLLQGQSLPDIGYWNMDHDTEWNAQQSNMPSGDMLETARRTTATLTALTAVAIFLIGTRLTTTIGAVVGALIFAVHPLTKYLSTFAGSDAALVFFLLLSALFAARLAEKPTWTRAALLGIAIGLGGGVKLSPLGIAIALAVIGLPLLAMKSQRSPRLARMLLMQPIIAGATFVISYPYLWRNPIENSLNLLRYRTMSFDLQSSLWGQVAIDSPFEAIERIWSRFASEEWSILGRFFGIALPIENLLAIAGLMVLAILVIRRGLSSPTAMIAATIGASTAITILGMQVDWARYHFPILVAMTMCIGVAVGSAQMRLTADNGKQGEG